MFCVFISTVIPERFIKSGVDGFPLYPLCYRESRISQRESRPSVASVEQVLRGRRISGLLRSQDQNSPSTAIFGKHSFPDAVLGLSFIKEIGRFPCFLYAEK